MKPHLHVPATWTFLQLPGILVSGRRSHERHCCSREGKCQCKIEGINPDLSTPITSVGKQVRRDNPISH